jgi:hypothetical protein
MDDLQRIIGREVPLDQFHLIVRRAAMSVPGMSAYGACLVTCSDERQGVMRSGFDRDVASPLISDVTNARDRVFAVSNLCGRLEPGAFDLVDNHFSRPAARGPKLLVFEIASHVGRIRQDSSYIYGEVERFRQRSPCCGALTVLLDPPADTEVVRHPWFEQLNAFFGPVRLATLRGITDSRRMIAAAIVHAALQAESVIAEVLNSPPATTTDVLLLSGVAVNQQWADGFLPVSWHRLRAENSAVRIQGGFSLRTTPEALAIDISGPRIHVAGGQAMEGAQPTRRRTPVVHTEPDSAALAAAAKNTLASLAPEQKEALHEHLDAARAHVESVRHDPSAWRTYSRPILRGLFRGLTILQPELGLAALLFEGGKDFAVAHKLRRALREGPRTPEGRRVLHDIEAELQQLNHEDAQQVLDLLLSHQK